MVREGAGRGRTYAARTKRQPPTREFNEQAGALLNDQGNYAVNEVDEATLHELVETMRREWPDS